MPISYAYFDASLSGKNAGRKCADERNQDKTQIAWAASDFAAEGNVNSERAGKQTA